MWKTRAMDINELQVNDCTLEALDTFRQHSQLTAWYCLDYPSCSAELKANFLNKTISHVSNPPFLSCSKSVYTCGFTALDKYVPVGT